MAYDFPNSPSNGDIIQTAGQRFEFVSADTRWEWRGKALLNNGLGITVPGTNTWSDIATSLTSTDCVQLSLNNSTWTTNISVTNGGTFYTRWDPGVACDGAPHGTTIVGTITDDNTGATQSYSKTIDKVPGFVVFSPSTASVGTAG